MNENTNNDDIVQLERGALVISLDLELIWGTIDLFGPVRFRSACLRGREIIDDLLELFVRYEISATWCIVGHLFLDSCHHENGCKHPEIVRPKHSWFSKDWFAHDPCSDEDTNPEFYGSGLIDRIQQCTVPQEIGCHTFSHVIFGDAGCSPETANSELATCIETAERANIRLESFAFPRNQVGHLSALAKNGFRCFRGPDEVWYEKGTWPEWIRRLAHLCDVVCAACPPVVLPRYAGQELWNIPGSMIYFPMHGFRRYLPVRWRVSRAVKGLNRAAAEKRIFHLWFHPTNFADETPRMLEGLESILRHADRLRREKRLSVYSMRDMIPAEESSRTLEQSCTR